MRRVLIVDDHQPFRAVARRLLERDGFDVVGEADGGEVAMVAARSLRPDVVLLDVQLPDTDGFAICERLLAEAPATLVVLTSGRARSTYRRRLASSAARAFIPKSDLVPGALSALIGLE